MRASRRLRSDVSYVGAIYRDWRPGPWSRHDINWAAVRQTLPVAALAAPTPAFAPPSQSMYTSASAVPVLQNASAAASAKPVRPHGSAAQSAIKAQAAAVAVVFF